MLPERLASSHAFRALSLVLLLLCARGALAEKPKKPGGKAGASDRTFEGKPADILKKLKARAASSSGDAEKTRLDLLAFERAFPGTPDAVEAAGLVRGLPSPLDRLDARAIPPLEKYDWQPKNLVAVLGEHKGRHGYAVLCVAYSPDGKLVASGGSNSLVRLWDPANLRLKGVLGHDSYVSALAFTNDGQKLIGSSYAGTVRIWDITANPPKLEHRFQASSGHLYSMAVSPDGKLVACGGVDTQVHFWKLDGKEPKEFKVMAGHTKPISCVAFSKSGKTLVSGGYGGKVRLWRVEDDGIKVRAVLDGSGKGVYSLGFDSDGRRLAAGMEDGSVHIWAFTAEVPKISLVLPTKAGVIYSLAFSPSGKRLALGAADNNVHFWEMAGDRSRERFVLKGHESYVSGVAFSRDGKLLASGSADATVRSWSLVGKAKERFPVKGHLWYTFALAFAPDGKAIASASYDRSARLWSVTGIEFKERRRMSELGVPLYTVAFTPDGKMVAGAGASAVVQLWSSATGRPVKQLKDFPAAIGSLAITPDGNKCLCICLKLLCVWDIRTGKKIKTLDGHTLNITHAALSPDGRWALTCAGYYKYSPKGEIVIIKGEYQYEDCTVRLWDLRKGLQEHQFNLPKPLTCVAFAPDGSQAQAGGWLGYMETFNLAPPAPAGRISGQSGYVYSIVYSPDGKLLASTGPDGQVTVWDLASAKKIYTWEMKEDVRQVAFAPDSRHIAFGLGTGPVYVVRLAGAKK